MQKTIPNWEEIEQLFRNKSGLVFSQPVKELAALNSDLMGSWEYVRFLLRIRMSNGTTQMNYEWKSLVYFCN